LAELSAKKVYQGWIFSYKPDCQDLKLAIQIATKKHPKGCFLLFSQMQEPTVFQKLQQ
jgi:hypothetical protein